MNKLGNEHAISPGSLLFCKDRKFDATECRLFISFSFLTRLRCSLQDHAQENSFQFADSQCRLTADNGNICFLYLPGKYKHQNIKHEDMNQ